MGLFFKNPMILPPPYVWGAATREGHFESEEWPAFWDACAGGSGDAARPAALSAGELRRGSRSGADRRQRGVTHSVDSAHLAPSFTK